MDNVPVEFICGRAGVGKTYTIKERSEQDPDYALLCATTGIAAVNLGTVTLHSTLHYFNTQSLMEQLIEGRLQRSLYKIQKDYKWLAIDETSMMHGDQLDILMRGVQEVNNYEGADRQLGVILIADFCQLPPVPDKDKLGNPIPVKWAFETESWPLFEQSVTRLTKVWRQSNQDFISMLNFVRSGFHANAIDALRKLDIRFNQETAEQFQGTTIFAKNQQVDDYNWKRLMQLQGPYITVHPKRWGRQLKEWERNIPGEVKLKKGAYVMLLANQYEGDFSNRELVYANGDTGYVEDYDSALGEFTVRLDRKDENGSEKVVRVERTTRYNEQKHKPTPEEWERFPENEKPYKDESRRKWILGTIDFFPIRVAYATTCHKSQGLSLDRVQINFSNRFFGSPNMLYVALSRCRTPEGMRLVGNEKMFQQRCNLEPKVRRWL